MNKNFFIIAFLIIIFKFYGVEIIEAPFISKLTFEVSKRKVLLNWQNPSGFNQYISIYRSNIIIDSANKLPMSEKVAVLKNYEEKYIDSPPLDGEYYYAALITNKMTNENSAIFIPYRNFTIKPAVIITEEYFEITNLTAASKNTYVKIDWDYKTESKSTSNVIIYRNTKPILSNEILFGSIKIILTDIKNKSFIDVPLPYINYYYAIFIEDEKERTYKAGINATINPVSINEKSEIFPEFSVDNFIPLPLIILQNDPKTDKSFLDPQILKNPKKLEYNENVKSIINNYRIEFNEVYNSFMKENQKNQKKLEFRLLNNEDIFETKEYNIEYKNAISYIQKKDYDPAQKILEELIRELLPDELLKRASYYLGQIYYAKGNNNMAYIYLIYPYDSFKNEIEPFLYSIYLQIFNSL